MAFSIPVVETERTIMRGWSADDLDAFAGWSADPEVMRFIGGVGTRDMAWRAMSMHAGHWALRGYGTWAVQRRSDGVLLGRVGLWNPEGWPGIEVGWTLARHAWGEGFATECARAALTWGWDNLADLPRIISVIDPDNTASQNVATRLGMTVVGTWKVASLEDREVLLYGVDRPASDSTTST